MREKNMILNSFTLKCCLQLYLVTSVTFGISTFFPLCKGGPLQTGKKSRSYFPAKRHFAVNKVKYKK